jgi:2'-5' RNA ligase
VNDRLFFALWPDDVLREVLARRIPELVRGYPCKPQRPDQWHLTLEFIGSVEAVRQPALHAAAGKVHALPGVAGDIVLDRLEHWARPQVLCLSASVVQPALSEFVGALRAELLAQGFEPERREFRPHLTLARKARQPVPSGPVDPLRWPVRDFVLARSVTDAAGSRYEPLARWNLSQTLTPTPSR